MFENNYKTGLYEKVTIVRTVMEMKHRDIFLYVPNLIGYMRFIFLLMAVRYAYDPKSWHVLIQCYTLS